MHSICDWHKDYRVEHRGHRSRPAWRSDVGLRYFSRDRTELVAQEAGSESMLVVAQPGHRLARRRVRDARLLAGERLIRAGLHDADVTLIDSLTAQKRLAQAGFGLALVPESSVRDELRRGLLVTLNVPTMRTVIPIFAIHRRSGYLSPAASALLALLTRRTVR